MKVLVCGSRDWTNVQKIGSRLYALDEGTVVIHGAAMGADIIGGVLAEWFGYEVIPFPAKWRENGVYNPRAGFERNRLMLDQNPDLVIAFQVGTSNGTQDTIDEARRRDIPVEVIR